MEKIRKKRIALMSVGIALVLIMAGVMTFSIWALVQARVDLGVSITYKAVNINALISQASVTGNTTDLTGKMQEISIDAENNGTSQITTWSNVQLQFNSDADDVVLSFTITNRSPNQYLKVDIDREDGTSQNAKLQMTINDTSETMIYIPPYSQDTTDNVAKIKITFSVTDPDLNASITGCKFIYNLENVDYPTFTLSTNLNRSVDDVGSLHYVLEGESEEQDYLDVISVRSGTKLFFTYLGYPTPDWDIQPNTLYESHGGFIFDETYKYTLVVGDQASTCYSASGVHFLIEVTKDTEISLFIDDGTEEI